jgi:hypothetical protein
MTDKKYEVWLRGPVDGIPALLQLAAHALLQAREEINTLMEEFPDNLLWEKPAGAASPGFHLQHIKGVMDRLLTYARGETLTAEQLSYLKQEEHAPSSCNTGDLVEQLNRQVDKALTQLAATVAFHCAGVINARRRTHPATQRSTPGNRAYIKRPTGIIRGCGITEGASWIWGKMPRMHEYLVEILKRIVRFWR